MTLLSTTRYRLMATLVFVALGTCSCNQDSPDRPDPPPLVELIPDEALGMISIDWPAVAESRHELADRLGIDLIRGFENDLLEIAATHLGTRADLSPFVRGVGPRTANWFAHETALLLMPNLRTGQTEAVLLIEHKNREIAEKRMAALVYFVNSNIAAILDELVQDNPYGLDPAQGSKTAAWLRFFDLSFLRKKINDRDIHVLKLGAELEICWIATDRVVLIAGSIDQALATAEALERASITPPEGPTSQPAKETGNKTLIYAFMDDILAEGDLRTTSTHGILEDPIFKAVTGSEPGGFQLMWADAVGADAETLRAIVSFVDRIALLLKQQIGLHTYR